MVDFAFAGLPCNGMCEQGLFGSSLSFGCFCRHPFGFLDSHTGLQKLFSQSNSAGRQMNFIWVFIGGGLGSVARYGIGFIFSRWIQSSFPWATFISNLLATGILGVITYLFLRSDFVVVSVHSAPLAVKQ
jgi:hypothetical protein